MSTRRTSEHTLELADHLWEVLEQAAFEMGADPSFLVNQALFAWAVQHGYLQPGSMPRPAARAVPAPPPPPKAAPPRSPVPPPKVAPTAFPKKDVKAKPLTSVTTQVTPAFVPPKREADPPPVPEVAAPSQSLLDYLPGEAPVGEEEPGFGGTAVMDIRGPKPDRTVVGRPERRLFAFIEGRDTVEVPKGKFIIGRDENCDLPLISSRISRHHAQVTRDANGVTIEDLNSSNGTWFNDERITKRGIEHGDEFVVGDYIIRFEYE